MCIATEKPKTWSCKCCKWPVVFLGLARKKIPHCSVLYSSNIKWLIAVFCEVCDNKRFIGNAWENKRQKCFKCERMIQAKNLRPLQRTLGPQGPPHREDLCEMCKELGYNCRNYHSTPPADDDGD